ncbi:MAG: hypothetical protein QM692_03775 [Thermomicrobiales bacterium]
MAISDSITTDAAEGLPRRKAIQGLAAGSLAGMAALGVVNASAKKKKKKPAKSSSGTLVKFQSTSKKQSIAANSTGTLVTATCPAAASGEVAFATGGGFILEDDQGSTFPLTSQVASDGKGWVVNFVNAGGSAEDASTNVVCAYFKA